MDLDPYCCPDRRTRQVRAAYPVVFNTVRRDQPWLAGPTQTTQSRKGPGGTVGSLDWWKSGAVRPGFGD